MVARPYQTEAIASLFNFFNTVTDVERNPLVAIPGGGGKAYIICEFMRQVLQQWPGQRIMQLVHVKELVAQNATTLERIWPNAPYGIHSASLKKRQTQPPIIFGGTASVFKYKDIADFGHRDLLIIDEAHLLSNDDDSMLHKIIAGLRKINPKLRVIGFTATPYRMGQGLLTDDGGLFTDIVFDITHYQAFNRMIAEGYLCPLISKRTINKIDLTGVGLDSNGDYKQSEVEAVLDTRDTLYKILKEAVEYGANRKSWLVFTSGIKNAETVCQMLAAFGVVAVVVHSKISADARDTAISDFKTGKVRAMVGNNVFTTGFDHPPVDLIVMLRPTTSVGLWIQTLSRGTRVYKDKKNCLCLDFAQNTARLGPMNDPVIPRPKNSKGTQGVVPAKICDQCGCYNHTNATVCCNCGWEFPKNQNLTPSADTLELLRVDGPQLTMCAVTRVIYTRYQGRSGKPPVLKVTYICGNESYDQVVCLEHPAPVIHAAHAWWKNAMGTDKAPPTVDEALRWTSRLKVPKTIFVDLRGKDGYPTILKVNY
jgi:DNA repair protein RadD